MLSTRSTRRSSRRAAPWRLEIRRPRTHVGVMDIRMSRREEPGESLLKFPCAFPMKVMGRREDGFAQLVSEIVLKHAADFDPATIEMGSAKQGRYQSITLTTN